MKMINEKLQMPGNASGASLKYEGGSRDYRMVPLSKMATNKIKQHVAKIPNLTLR